VTVCQFTGRNESPNLRLAPIQLCQVDRAAEQFINEPNAVRVQDVAFAVPGDLIDPTGMDHLLDAAAIQQQASSFHSTQSVPAPVSRLHMNLRIISKELIC
jgi:hypothetical protein